MLITTRSRWFIALSTLALAACTSPPSGSAPSDAPKPTPPAPVANDPPEVADPPSADQTPPKPTEPVTAPTDPIASALAQVPASIAERYLLSISDDRRELTIDPRPEPARRSAVRGGFSVRDSEAGGKIISLYGGPFRNGGWVRASLRERAPAERLAELIAAGYDVDEPRDLLVVDGESDPKPTVFAFSADPTKPGIVGVCSEVTIMDFGTKSPAPIAVRKPVIYLYPETTTKVRVTLDVAGRLVAVYPAMHDESWTVTASPDGQLRDEATGRSHRYLFWEAESTGFAVDPERAHCIAGSDAVRFLEEVCEAYALTDHECGDMVTYWLPELSRNPYNVIELVDPAVYGRYATLRVEPEPDVVIRPFMIFERSEAPVKVGAPPLPRHRRGGFTVVEWGGASLDEATEPGVVIH